MANLKYIEVGKRKNYGQFVVSFVRYEDKHAQ